MKDKSTSKRIYDATLEAGLAFVEREALLKKLQVAEVKPLITRLINKINTEPMTEQNLKDFVNDLTYVKDQLTLRRGIKEAILDYQKDSKRLS